jgi:hypothetical protein
LMGAPPKGDGTVTAGEPATWIQCSMQKLWWRCRQNVYMQPWEMEDFGWFYSKII